MVLDDLLRDAIAPSDAPQHGPRPLPLFLAMLREETAASPDRRAAALRGLAAYQHARRPPRPRPMPARARKGRARLRDYGGTGPPVVLVPSLINPPDVLDLAPGRSFARWLAGQGLHVWMVDWGTPLPRDRGLDVAGHVADRLVPLLAKLPAPPLLVGYCLGGTMALAAAALWPVAGVATIAAPWRFAGYGDARADMAALWEAARPPSDALGLMPVEVLQAGFWRLDPARTIAKFERFGALPPDGEEAAAFVRLEDWANGGPPLTYAAGVELFEAMIAQDAPGAGRWTVGGRVVDPARLACPAIEFVSLTDRIVPAQTAAGLAERHDLALGHVGMMVGGQAQAALWSPLAAWLRATAAP